MHAGRSSKMTCGIAYKNMLSPMWQTAVEGNRGGDYA